jgi:hypothetical protein
MGRVAPDGVARFKDVICEADVASFLVAVEIAPPDAAVPLKQALLDACARASEERCVEPQPEQTEPNIVAIVSWQDAQHARLEVALRREQRWVARTMAFSDQDPAEERWRAVGLVIGTLASLIANNKEPPPEETLPRAAPPADLPKPTPTPAPSPTPSEPAASARPPEHDEGLPTHAPAPLPPAHDGWVSASLVVGTALDHGAPRMGGEIDANIILGKSVYGVVGLAYSGGLTRIEGVQSTFAEALAGLLYEEKLSRTLSACVHGEGLVLRFAPSVADSNGGTTDGERWLGGVRLGADVLFWGADPVGFFLGGAGQWTAAATDVRFEGKPVGSAPSLGYVVKVGTSIGFR